MDQLGQSSWSATLTRLGRSCNSQNQIMPDMILLQKLADTPRSHRLTNRAAALRAIFSLRLADVDGPVFPVESPAGKLTCSMLVPIAISDNHAVLPQYGVIVPGVGVAVFPVVQWWETVAAVHAGVFTL